MFMLVCFVPWQTFGEAKGLGTMAQAVLRGRQRDADWHCNRGQQSSTDAELATCKSGVHLTNIIRTVLDSIMLISASTIARFGTA